MRAFRAKLREIVSDCCETDEMCDQVVDRLIEAGLRPPTITITRVEDLDAIPDGSAVLIGNVTDPEAKLAVGRKALHCVLLTGEDEPYPFHQDGLAPPLPCSIVWYAGETTEEPVQSEADGVVASLLMQANVAAAPGDFT